MAHKISPQYIKAKEKTLSGIFCKVMSCSCFPSLPVEETHCFCGVFLMLPAFWNDLFLAFKKKVVSWTPSCAHKHTDSFRMWSSLMCACGVLYNHLPTWRADAPLLWQTKLGGKGQQCREIIAHHASNSDRSWTSQKGLPALISC